jgi:hypothetical protein
MAASLTKQMEIDAAHAVKLVREMHSIKLPYSAAGIRLLEEVPEWLEGGGGLLLEMVETTFLFKDENPLEALAVSFGSYVGEVFRRTCGGRWVSHRDESGTSVALLVGGMKLFPHQKVLKRLLELKGDGEEHNVWNYFQVMRDLCGKERPSSAGKAVGKRAKNRAAATRKQSKGSRN